MLEILVYISRIRIRSGITKKYIFKGKQDSSLFDGSGGPWTMPDRRGVPQEIKELFSDYLFKVKIPQNIIYLLTKTILLCYRSQYKSWILLLPAILISMIRSNYGKFVLANELRLKDIMNTIPKKPLYQIYRGLNPQEWLDTIEENFHKINKV